MKGLSAEYVDFWLRQRNIFIGLVTALIASNVFVGITNLIRNIKR